MLSGSVHVHVESSGYVACEFSGVVTVDVSRGVQEQLDRLTEEHPEIDRILFDGTEVSTFERGIPIFWIRWAQSRSRLSRRVAVVTRLAAVAAVSSVVRVMLPRATFAVFTDRRAAVAYLCSENDVGAS